MAAHIVLLFLLLCDGERNGISVAAGFSEEVQDLQELSSKTQQVLHHPESVGSSVFFMRGKEEDDIKPPLNVALKLNDREHNDSDFKSILAGQPVILEHPEPPVKSLIPKHNPELSLNREKRSNLTNGEVEGVINDHSRAPSSEEESALQPELHLETGVVVLHERTQERSKWVTESEGGRSGPKTGPRSRRRRSWLWNQFFVIEEYRGPEPVLIGRVGPLSQPLSVCMCLHLLCHIRHASFTAATPAAFSSCRCRNTGSVRDDLIHNTPELLWSQGFTCSIPQPGSPH